MHLRDYMEYHSERFTDASLLFYKKGKPIAILPAAVKTTEASAHRGLSYAGLIQAQECKSAAVLEIFDLIGEHFRSKGCKSFYTRPVPHVYHRQPAEEELYALFRVGAKLVSRGLSSAFRLSDCELESARRDGVRKAKNAGLHFEESERLDLFWPILNQNLHLRHSVKPVHSLSEIELLRDLFPQNIRLFSVFDGSETLGGAVIYETERVIHSQYISATPEGKRLGAIDGLFDWLLREYYMNDYRLFEFGVSTEQGGQVLNEGLIWQKEGFGGRGVVYDAYLWEFA